MKSPSAEQIRNTLLAVCVAVSASLLGYLQREPRASEILSEEDLANEIKGRCESDNLNLATYQETIDFINKIEGYLNATQQLVVMNDSSLTGVEGEYVIVLIDTNKDLSVLPLADFVNLPPNTTSFCIEG